VILGKEFSAVAADAVDKNKNKTTAIEIKLILHKVFILFIIFISYF
jgi:hypothetical protein